MAPGISARQISPSQWSVSIRGFDGRFAPKLLVLVDGRSVYTPTFAGTYWEMQDLMLDDIERIEVIRGPGATLWGSNAVNGVINIITRAASDDLDKLLTTRVGSQQQSAGLRWTGKLGSGRDLRAYLKATDSESFEDETGLDHSDDFTRQQAGFRSDWLVGERNQFSVHGDIQHLSQGQAAKLPDPNAPPTFETLNLNESSADSFNIVGRWQHSVAVDSEFSLQWYIDHYDREEQVYQDKRLTFDVDFQHQFAYTDQQKLT